MSLIYTFKRVEKKYIINQQQYNALTDIMKERMTPDIYGRSTICSLYLDTEDFRIIRASIDADNYKEKIRLRSYGLPSPDQTVFLELKKKNLGFVYKRRISLPLSAAVAYLQDGIMPQNSQIMREIDYAMQFYHHPKPAVLLFYERDAFTLIENPALRITFDSDIRYRTDNLLFGTDCSGRAILPDDKILMEIKSDGVMPLWLAHALDSIHIVPSSFSKYGTAYAELCLQR